jgi:hypothetical protein
MKHDNPNINCTWDDQADCSNCSIHGKLACKWDKKILCGFHGIVWPSLITSVFGMVVVGFLTGAWWPLISFIVYFFLMFGILEIRFLCCHCPYYAEEGNVLHCLANHGSLKIWKYRPGPLNKFEKFMMYFLLATIFFLFPLSVLGYGIGFISLNYDSYGLITLLGLVGIALANLASSLSVVISLKLFFCPNCINFSCPLNTVPKSDIDEYLRKNDVMRAAWEKSGWVMD